MCKLKKVSTKDMSREDWLKHRRSSIGGSDAGALLGLNKYTSPYALWAEKTGKVIPDDISDKEAVRLGNDLEQYVADRWMEATGKKLRKENNILYNPDFPFAHANIDRAVIGEPDAVFEAKTTSNYEILKQCREGSFPDTWYCQVTHYMMVTGAKRLYLGVLCLGHGFYHFTIERNDDEIAALAAAERDFWRLVQDQIPPPIDGSEATEATLQSIFNEGNGDSTDLTGVIGQMHVYYQAKQQAKQLEAEMRKAQNSIMAEMGNAESGRCNGYKVSWKNQLRRTFDRDQFEKDNGKLPDEYFKTSTSRPFKVTAI